MSWSINKSNAFIFKRPDGNQYALGVITDDDERHIGLYVLMGDGWIMLPFIDWILTDEDILQYGTVLGYIENFLVPSANAHIEALSHIPPPIPNSLPDRVRFDLAKGAVLYDFNTDKLVVSTVRPLPHVGYP